MSVNEIMQRLADEAPDGDHRVFVRLVVAELHMAMLRSSAVPAEFYVPMRFADGTLLSIPVRPLIEDGETVDRLAKALFTMKRDDASFRVLAADMVDVAQGCGGAGLAVFLGDRPALAIGVAPDGDTLYVRTEGFDRAVVGMAGELPGLWEHVRRGFWSLVSAAMATIKRSKSGTRGVATNAAKPASRRRVPKRNLGRDFVTRSLQLSLPAMTVRRALRAIVIHSGKVEEGVRTPGAAPLLIPIRGQKTGAGAYPPRLVLERLRHALGVQTLLTDHALRNLLGSKTAAEMAIKEVTGDRLAHLRQLGRDHLTSRTAFDTEDEVKAWAAAKYRHVPHGNRTTAAVRQMQDEELAAVGILSRAYNHAQLVVAAYDVAEHLPVDQIAPSLEAVFLRKGNRTGMPVSELFQVAVFADVNPALFWPQHTDGFAAAFEAGRLMGQLQAGVSTEVGEVVGDLLMSYAGKGELRDAPDQFVAMVRQSIDDICGEDWFLAMLGRARKEGGVLISTES